MLCDVVVLYIVKRKSYYRTKKYQYVNDPEDEVNNQVCDNKGSSLFIGDQFES